MTSNIDIRKNIIISLKSSSYRNQKNGLEEQIKHLKSLYILNLLLTIFCAGIVTTSILTDLLGFDIFKWEKMEFFTLLSLTLILKLPYEFYGLKLLKHLKKIKSLKEFEQLENLNFKLKNIVDDLNNRKKKNLFVIILALAIMISGMLKIIYDDLNSYWTHTKIPTLLLYGIIIFNFIRLNNSLTQNIEKTESHL